MEALRQYAVSVVSAAILCSILSGFPGQDSTKKVLHLITGIVLVLVLIRPVSTWELPEMELFPGSSEANGFVEDGKELAQDAMADIIKSACETYILDKARDMGANITVNIHVDPELIPDAAVIGGPLSTDIQNRLEAILEKDLGIAKENHTWTG